MKTYTLASILRDHAPILYHIALNLKSRFYARRSYSLKFLEQYRLNGTATVALDLGCGASPNNIFNADVVMGVDVGEHESKDIKVVDLAIDGLPYADTSFDVVTAFDLLEHIPRVIYLGDAQRRQCFLELMQEIHRVLKPDGLFLSHTPVYPHPFTFVDPTHVNFITERTFDYFVGEDAYAKNYGYTGLFQYVENRKVGGHLVTLLKKKEIL